MKDWKIMFTNFALGVGLYIGFKYIITKVGLLTNGLYFTIREEEATWLQSTPEVVIENTLSLN